MRKTVVNRCTNPITYFQETQSFFVCYGEVFKQLKSYKRTPYFDLDYCVPKNLDSLKWIKDRNNSIDDYRLN